MFSQYQKKDIYFPKYYNNFYELIKKSLEHYDNYTFQNMKKQKKIKNYKIKNINKNKQKLELYDNNNNKIYNGEFQTMITFKQSQKHKNYVWSWANIYYNNHSYYSKELLEYSYNLEYNEALLRELLINKLVSINNIDDEHFEIFKNILVSVIFYLMKKDNFFVINTNYKNGLYNDYVYLIDNVDF